MTTISKIRRKLVQLFYPSVKYAEKIGVNFPMGGTSIR